MQMQKVELKYHRKRHYMGTYTWEHAVLVSEVARGKLEATRDSNLTADEIDLNVKLAKEAALEALSEFQDSANAQITVVLQIGHAEHARNVAGRINHV